MYIIIPLCIFEWGLDIPLSFIFHQFTFTKEIKILVIILVIIVTYKLYKWIMHIIFRKLQLNLKTEWMNYLTIKDWKISYYKEISSWVYTLNDSDRSLVKFINSYSKLFSSAITIFSTIIIVFLCFVFCAIVSSWYQKSTTGYEVLKSEILRNYILSFNIDVANLFVFFFYTILLTSILLFTITVSIVMFDAFLFECIFPVTNGRIDTSDCPISFIKKAIEEIKNFNFSDNITQKQNNKNQITQLISYASNYYIRVDNKNQDIYFINLCFPLWAGHLSEAARNDVLFRTNGLYKKIDRLCADINNMNSPEKQSRILYDLEICLKAIENRDLSEIDPVEYEITKSDLTSSVLKVAAFINKIL